MNPSQVLLIAFAIGVIAGLRSLTAPAAVAWAARRGWLSLHGTALAFMGSLAAVVIFTILAVVELVADQLPATPARTKPVGLTARIITGGVSGAAVALAGGQSALIGACLGAVGGIAGAFGGYWVRTGVVRGLKVPDFAVAVVEDLVATAGAVFLVMRF
jgi:uncharacterized membrane protein